MAPARQMGRLQGPGSTHNLKKRLCRFYSPTVSKVVIALGEVQKKLTGTQL